MLSVGIVNNMRRLSASLSELCAVMKNTSGKIVQRQSARKEILQRSTASKVKSKRPSTYIKKHWKVMRKHTVKVRIDVASYLALWKVPVTLCYMSRVDNN